MLADKVSGNLVGTWLLIPEYLRLGVWDLLCAWSGCSGEQVQPRVALQLVNEGALCTHGVRYLRSLSQRGFEVANGLPFVASDTSVHQLLAAHTVADAQELQVALGQVRRASGHFRGRLLALDPHRLESHTRRQTAQRKQQPESSAHKVTQTFFCFDVDTQQPLCFALTSSGPTVTHITPELLSMAQCILNPVPGQTLLLADREYYSDALISHVQRATPFDILMPLPSTARNRKVLKQIPDQEFTRRWAGYATTKQPFSLAEGTCDPLWLYAQRGGERPDQCTRQGFVCTADRPEVEGLTEHYPARWHIEEHFNRDQAIGWNRAGTLNMNIRYGHMSTALIAQAAIAQLRQRLQLQCTAQGLATTMLAGLDGDLRVKRDTIIVTYYNARLTQEAKNQLCDLPDRLAEEGVDPRIPWLYGLKLNFRFR